MAIPSYQSLMLPVLRLAAEGERPIGDAIELLANDLALSESERTQMLPSGREARFSNRVRWAVTYLLHAGLIERPRRGYYIASDVGRRVLDESPDHIDVEFLERFEGFRKFRGIDDEAVAREDPNVVDEEDETPEERVEAAASELNDALRVELLERVYQGSPEAFEQLIIDLMRAMGYGRDGGSTKRLGKTHDGGVDGVINEDVLGLNTIYLQAKRYDPYSTVGVGKIREFSGSLDDHRASRGVFVTTARFAAGAREYAERNPKRLVLIDGDELTRHMIEHHVGVRTGRSIHLKKIDSEYFDEMDLI